MNRRIGTGALVVAAAITQAVLVAGVAHAAPGQASVQGGALVFTADAGDANNVVITLVNGAYIIDDVVAITPGPGCGPVDSTKVSCISNGVSSIRVNANDLADTINNLTATRSTLNGDDGDDDIFGGFGNDIMRGGNGADTFTGRAGSDGVTYSGVTIHVSADPDG